MAYHPINLAIRLILELSALVAAGMWGYRLSETWFRFALMIIIPVVLATLWGTFAVPEDPSRSGNAPVVTPGFIRLVLEFFVLGFGAWALYDLGYTRIGIGMGIVILLHYLVSYERIVWLLTK